MPTATGTESTGRAVVCYNVHGCRGRDGVHDIDRCLGVIADTQPVILGLQEVDSREGHDVWRIFEHELDMVAIAGPTLTGERGRYGNLLLTRYPIRGVRHHDLSVGAREPRRAIDATLAAPEGALRVILTHLGLGLRERHAQFRRLSAAVHAHWRGQPTLLLGDFNVWLRPGQVGPRLHPQLHARCLPRSFPSPRPLLALDQIWCYPSTLIARLTTLDTPTARVASDHLPLLATLAGRAQWSIACELQHPRAAAVKGTG